jgi:hypothetical protein
MFTFDAFDLPPDPVEPFDGYAATLAWCEANPDKVADEPPF